MSYMPLPIGIDDFGEIIEKGYYYVDKTWFIKGLLDKMGKVNLFTRPRRFGKTLNISMLKYFFEMSVDGENYRYLFDGLRIMDAGERYVAQQGQYPVIMLTLKSAKQPDFAMAHASLVDDIAGEYKRHSYVLESDDILDEDKEKFRAIRGQRANPVDYAKALAFLSECLYRYHRRRVIILIDEYDVPLENAYYRGFYEEMTSFLRSLFESALKTNPYLEFSVITGCLRISKESIFTGLNNLKINSILNEDYDEYFGFTGQEVEEMLRFYGREAQMDIVKKWYNGYRFGNEEVYNPWSVLNYTEKLYINENTLPAAEWSNTSSNSIVKDLVYHASDEVREQIETLMQGGTIEKKIHEDITYEDIHKSEDNLWNFLFFTGYLRMSSMRMEGVNRYITMSIPNYELLYIYENTVESWFHERVGREDLSALYTGILEGRPEVFQKELALQLQKTISYMDSGEAFYHGFLLGLLANLKNCRVKSNREAGDGRHDICIYHYDETIPPVLLELKVVRAFKEMEAAAGKALEQIEAKRYDAWLAEEGYTESIRYGIAFFKKKCRIRMERKRL